MNNYYNRLAESLTRKYSGKLNEAWGNVPSWMKSRLTNFAHENDFQNNYRSASTKNDKNSNYTYQYDRWTDYAKPRGGKRGEDLYAEMDKSPYDLLNATYIEGDPPRSTKDPRLQAPNIPIWFFENSQIPGGGQIYMKGVNDLEKLLPSTSYDAKNYAGKTFNLLPLKTMADMCSAFAYIDGSTLKLRPETNAQKIRRRTDERQSLPKNYNRHPEWANQTMYSDSYDRSGYIVVPTSEKYAKELRLRGLRNYAQKLQDAEAQIQEYRDKIVDLQTNFLSMADASSLGGNNSSFGDMSYILSQANTYYKNILEGIDYIISDEGRIRDSDEFIAALDEYPTRFTRNMKRIKEKLGEIQTYIDDSSYDFEILDF